MMDEPEKCRHKHPLDPPWETAQEETHFLCGNANPMWQRQVE